MITVEERLKRIEGQLDRIAKALEDMNKYQKLINKQPKNEDHLPEEVTLYSPEESD